VNENKKKEPVPGGRPSRGLRKHILKPEVRRSALVRVVHRSKRACKLVSVSLESPLLNEKAIKKITPNRVNVANHRCSEAGNGTGGPEKKETALYSVEYRRRLSDARQKREPLLEDEKGSHAS